MSQCTLFLAELMKSMSTREVLTFKNDACCPVPCGKALVNQLHIIRKSNKENAMQITGKRMGFKNHRMGGVWVVCLGERPTLIQKFAYFDGGWRLATVTSSIVSCIDAKENKARM